MKALITDVTQATPDRLTSILHEQGCLSHGEVVTVRKDSPYFSGMSILSRLTLGYSSGASALAPSRLLLKIPLPEPDWIVTPGQGRKEVDFYCTVANAMSHAPAVRCYDAVYCPRSDRSHLLLDDMSATHSRPEFPLPPLNRHCDQLIDRVVQLHAFWWNHPRLGGDIGVFPDDEFVRQHFEKLEKAWCGFADFLGDRLPPERRRLYEVVLSSWPKLWQQRRGRFANVSNITLIHGDLHCLNVLFPHSPPKGDVYLIDWENWRVSVGTDDLAYMIALQWSPERRSRMEMNLLRRYHTTLLRHGVTHYDWEDCWCDYRLSVVRQLFVPVLLWLHELPPDAWWPHLENAALAYQDLTCAELLES